MCVCDDDDIYMLKCLDIKMSIIHLITMYSHKNRPSLLHNPAKRGQVDIVRSLLEYGAGIGAQNEVSNRI